MTVCFGVKKQMFMNGILSYASNHNKRVYNYIHNNYAY